MVIKKQTIERIRKIIDKHYSSLSLSILGRKNVPSEIIQKLNEAGLDTSNQESIPEKVYIHNWLNKHGSKTAPMSVEEMDAQQQPQVIPIGAAHDASIEHLSSSFYHLMENHKGQITSRIEGLIRDNNNDYKFNALQNLDRLDSLDDLVKEGTIGDLKRKLRDVSVDANRNWERVAVTEISNAVGLGSVDRIVSNNKETPLREVYVYRIVVNDAALCKYCRRFYLDSDGSPKVYRLSQLLANGSNYGKKTVDWLPVITSTHPNERCSQSIELKPGWKVLPGGRSTYMGSEKWSDYIHEKVE